MKIPAHFCWHTCYLRLPATPKCCVVHTVGTVEVWLLRGVVDSCHKTWILTHAERPVFKYHDMKNCSWSCTVGLAIRVHLSSSRTQRNLKYVSKSWTTLSNDYFNLSITWINALDSAPQHITSNGMNEIVILIVATFGLTKSQIECYCEYLHNYLPWLHS